MRVSVRIPSGSVVAFAECPLRSGLRSNDSKSTTSQLSGTGPISVYFLGSLRRPPSSPAERDFAGQAGGQARKALLMIMITVVVLVIDAILLLLVIIIVFLFLRA